MKHYRHFFALLALALFVAFPGVARASECGAFPSVSWWGDLSHESVTRYVNVKHGGDWESYIGKWQQQKKKLQGIYQKHSAVVTKTGVKLEGELLKSYIQQLGQRIDITNCLAGMNNNEMDMETASGPAASPAQTRTVAFQEFSLEISTSCKNGISVFNLRNNGKRWPGAATFRILRTGNEEIVVMRRLRMSGGQKASFNVVPEKAGGEVGIWMKPSWVSRSFEYDAVVNCT